MKLFIPLLKFNDNTSLFFGYNSSKGWLEHRTSALFDKIFVLDELAFCDEVRAYYSQETDLVLEELDLIERYRQLTCIEDAVALIDEIHERIVNGGDC